MTEKDEAGREETCGGFRWREKGVRQRALEDWGRFSPEERENVIMILRERWHAIDPIKDAAADVESVVHLLRRAQDCLYSAIKTLEEADRQLELSTDQ